MDPIHRVIALKAPSLVITDGLALASFGQQYDNQALALNVITILAFGTTVSLSFDLWQSLDDLHASNLKK